MDCFCGTQTIQVCLYFPSRSSQKNWTNTKAKGLILLDSHMRIYSYEKQNRHKHYKREHFRNSAALAELMLDNTQSSHCHQSVFTVCYLSRVLK